MMKVEPIEVFNTSMGKIIRIKNDKLISIGDEIETPIGFFSKGD